MKISVFLDANCMNFLCFFVFSSIKILCYEKDLSSITAILLVAYGAQRKGFKGG
jgi:hypothetical protein